MALASAKALLDELMGRERNLAPEEKKNEHIWNEPGVCKHFLVKFCPSELFVNTKADLGPCNKVHDEKIRKDYEKSTSYKQCGYEEDFLRFCQGMLSDVEKRIRRAKQRLALGNQEASPPHGTGNKNCDEKISVLTDRIKDLVEQVEHLGCEGKVEEAQGIMKLCDQLKEEREVLRASDPHHWLQATAEIAAAQEKQMEVCEVCGAFLIVGDAQQRVDDHLMGKQHVGYAKLKAAVEEILFQRDKEKEEREKEREKEREERMRQKEEEDKKREDRRKQLEEEQRAKREAERAKERGSSNRSHRSRSRDRRSKRSQERSSSNRQSSNKGRSSSRSRRSRSKDKDRARDSKNIRRRSRSTSRSRTESRHSSSKHSGSSSNSSKDRKRNRSRDKSKEHSSSSRRSRSKDKKMSRSGEKSENGERNSKEKKRSSNDHKSSSRRSDSEDNS